jgi:hypothetical protein
MEIIPVVTLTLTLFHQGRANNEAGGHPILPVPEGPPERILDFFFPGFLIIALMAISFTLWF